MQKIEKKCWTGWFEQILNGDKTYDLRLNDFETEAGDLIIFKEWDPKTKEYTGREVEKKVGYVGKWKIEELTTFWPKEEIEEKGLQIISLKDK